MSSSDNENKCGLYNGLWDAHRKEIGDMSHKLDATYEVLNDLASHAYHLQKLDVIASGITDMKNNLIAVATGKNQIPLDVAKELFTQSNNGNNTTIKILGMVVIVLLSVIGFLLIGEHFGWIRTLATP